MSKEEWAYPVTITREQLLDLHACEEGVAEFDTVAPSGSLVVADVQSHVALLSGALAEWEDWAIGKELLPPVRLTGGYGSNLTGGAESNLTGGDGSTLTGANWSNLTGGAESTLTGGEWSTLMGGAGSTLTGGDWSNLTGGHGSILTGGGWSNLTGGHGSILTGADRSTLTGGEWSTLTGGEWSTLAWRVWDGERHRIRLAYVGEDGIRAGVPYRWDEAAGRAVEVTRG